MEHLDLIILMWRHKELFEFKLNLVFLCKPLLSNKNILTNVINNGLYINIF